jgi:hypothetical protein
MVIRPAAITLLFATALALLPAAVTAQDAPVAPVLTRSDLVDHLTSPDARPLVQYRARRHLTASTRGGRMTASLDAWTTLQDGKFTFEVTSETGSSLIRRKVLLAALEAERDSQTTAARAQSALTETNYEFLAVSAAADRTLKLDIRPRRRHVMLVDGSLFFEQGSADLVRVEGELSKRPSFWTRRVRITRDYQRIDGVHVPVSMRSNADVLVAGESTFSMTYEYETINGRAVAQ